MATHTGAQHEPEPLVELAPEESVLRALIQSAHPVEFVESNKTPADADEHQQS